MVGYGRECHTTKLVHTQKCTTEMANKQYLTTRLSEDRTVLIAKRPRPWLTEKEYICTCHCYFICIFVYIIIMYIISVVRYRVLLQVGQIVPSIAMAGCVSMMCLVTMNVSL